MGFNDKQPNVYKGVMRILTQLLSHEIYDTTVNNIEQAQSALSAGRFTNHEYSQSRLDEVFRESVMCDLIDSIITPAIFIIWHFTADSH